MSLIPLNDLLVPFLEPYLPEIVNDRPFVTLTWAQSLDSKIAAGPGERTVISHLETKTMTHYLRSKHDAILVGIGTVLADDPKLNCRLPNSNSPRPVIIDPNGRWNYSESNLCKLVDNHQGKAPFIITAVDLNPDDIFAIGTQGGKIIKLDLSNDKLKNWDIILRELYKHSISSLMIEGGASIINDLLPSSRVDSVIITIGPVFLGEKGVTVSPAHQLALKNVNWWTGVQDSVIAAKSELREK